MRITLDQQGGIAGLAVRRVLDTAQLPADEAAAVEGLVEAARIFGQAGAPALPRRGFDLQRYRLVVDQDGRTGVLHFQDGAIPTEVAPLLARLRQVKPEVDRS